MVRAVPTLRGWVVGALGVAVLVLAGWFSRVDLLFAGLLLTLAPLAALIAVAFDRPWASVLRSYSPEVVQAGDEAQVRLELRNESTRSLAGFTWADRLPQALLPASSRAATGTGTGPGLGATDAVTLRYPVRPPGRGAFLLGPLRIVRADPFGLARCGHEVGDSKLLLVTPRVSELGTGGPAEARGEGDDPELVRRSIPSADEVIPRDYHPGDPLRRVQWRATARFDRLMVRQEEQLTNPASWLLLDTAGAPRAGSGAFEHAVELTASIAAHLLELGYLVGVHETGARQLTGSYELPGGDGLLLGQLAGVEQTAERDDDVGRFSGALRAGGTASPVFLVLVDGDPESWRPLAPLSRFAAPAVAFLGAPTALVAVPWLEAAGWVCVDIADGPEAADAWRRAARALRKRSAASGASRA